ncbi:hypothetical protein VH86_03845 [Pantoea sp. BL1]|uniref:hypothetical protein n=1 Tax=Pantoea sp. BL1 TaxID=1628190 RepID=UPI0005F85425|nr:hypothetical protein [Pantoea sp. BL1]KJV49627.1 hypothetical protein VH86_03845 [Pantoea sp. BL1]
MISDERLAEIAESGDPWLDEAQDIAKELLALRKAFSEPVGTIEATCDYVTDADWLQDIDSGEYLIIRKPTDSTT